MPVGIVFIERKRNLLQAHASRTDIVCVSLLAPPVREAESIVAAKHWATISQDFRITLITGSASGVVADPGLNQYLANMEVLRCRPRSFRNRSVERAWEIVTGREDVTWARRAAHQLPSGHRPRLLWSRSSPGASHLAALRLRNKYGRQAAVPWVVQISDPWCGNPAYIGRCAWFTEWRRGGWEARVCESADAFVFPCDELRQLYATRHPRVASRSHVIPHSIDPAAYPSPSAEPPTPSDVPNAVYVGASFYGVQSVDALIRACQGLRVNLRVVGNPRGIYRQRLEASGLRVSFSGGASYAESLREMRRADLLVVVDAGLEPEMERAFAPSPFLPSKLVDYLGARRPVFGIATPLSPTWRVLERYGMPVATSTDARRVLGDALGRLPALAEIAVTNDYREFEPEAVRDSFRRVFGSLGLVRG